MNSRQLEIKLVVLAMSFYFLLTLIVLGLIIFSPLILVMGALVASLYILMVFRVLIHIYYCIKGKNKNEYDIYLLEKDAPDLFLIVDNLKKQLKIIRPVIIALRTGETWIPYNGLLNTGGSIRIRLSNNDLAILSKDELKALIAIQLTHAVYVEKGIDGFIFNSIERMSSLLNTLDTMKANFLKPMIKRNIEKKLHYTVAYYLQYRKPLEEYADSKAIQICGESLYNSMTLKTHIAHFMGKDVFVREHYQQFNNGCDYWAWLRSRLTPADSQEEETVREWLLYTSVTSVYYAYQVLSDRIRTALTTDNDLDYSDMPSYHMLQNPSEVISKLLQTANETIKRNEKKNSREILSSEYNNIGSGSSSAIRLIGVSLIGIGVIFTIVIIFSLIFWNNNDPSFAIWAPTDLLDSFIMIIAFTAVGYIINKFSMRELIQIPIPDIDLWSKNASSKDDTHINEIATDLPNQPARDTIKQYRDACYYALMKCDYAQALASSESILKLSPSNIEAFTMYAIAKSHYGVEDIDENLNRIFKKFRFGPSFRWSLAWIGLNAGNLDFAEVNLLELTGKKHASGKLFAYLGFVQYHKAKYHEAEENFIKAKSSGYDTAACRMFYTDTLRELGRAKEAIRLLSNLKIAGDEDKWIRFRSVNTYISIDDMQKADETANAYIADYPESSTYINIADSYLDARVFDLAEHYYNIAYNEFKIPNALVGLARLEHERYRYGKSKEYLCQAMEMLCDYDSDAKSKLALLNYILSELLIMSKPVEDCSIWIADCHIEDNAIWTDQRITVSAMNANDATRYTGFILSKLYPLIDNTKIEFSNWMPTEDSRQLRAPGILNWKPISSI